MKPSLERQLAHFDESAHRALLTGIRRGVEKESLRITPEGFLSSERHPRALGSTLTHPQITTDYSEALMEFITPPSTALSGPGEALSAIHRFVYQHLGDEVLWSASMPCMLTAERDVPIAYYGTSNIGRMKYIYRVGLGHRYGRYMQTIAGVHYNFSYPQAFWASYQAFLGERGELQEFISREYFALVRNYLRQVWTIPYLFGASPAMCACFVKAPERSGLETLTPGTLYGPYATALRLGDLGYQNNAQAALGITYDSLEDYAGGLEAAIRTPDPEFAKIGVVDDNGEYRQLNDSVLQVENEYYATIRPKRTTERGERPALALLRRGVEYIEVRSLDLNPFSANGLNEDAMRFIDCLMLYSLFSDSPGMDDGEKRGHVSNLKTVVNRGREPGLMLNRNGQPVSLQTWGLELIDALRPFAVLLDKAYGVADFSASLHRQQEKFEDPSVTPSAQLVDALKQPGQSYYRYIRGLSADHKAYFQATPLAEHERRRFEAMAETSLAEQAALEAAEAPSFPEFLEAYYR